MDISVVIPCRNGEVTLAAQLDALLQQKSDYQFEVLVADNGSSDGTAALVRRYTARDVRVRLIDASRAPGINVARNEGSYAAAGKYVLLCDADDVVHEGWIDAFGRAFAQGADCVGGSVDRELADGTLLSQQRDLCLANFSPVPYPLGANCGFARAVHGDLGGFDEGFAGGSDEIEFFWRAHRAGHPTHFVPGAVISYKVRSGYVALWKQHYRYGRGNARLLRQFGSRQVRRRELMLIPPRLLRALAVLAASRQGTLRRRGGFESLGFQWGMLVDTVSRPRLYDSYASERATPAAAVEG